MKYSGKLPKTNVNVTESSQVKEITTLLVGLFLIIFTVYYILGLGIDFAVEKLTPDQERSLSTKIGKELLGMPRDKEISSFLQKFVERIQNKCINLPFKVKVFAVKNKGVNAIALPGGTIMVFSGLLERVRSENELTFILGHELGHFKNRDHLRGMGRAILLMIISSMLLGGDGGVDGILNPFLVFSESNHSREQESQADANALDLAQCYYGHVGGATDFFEGMLKEEEPSVFGHFLASHPAYSQRIIDIKNLINKFAYKQKAVFKLDKNLKLS